MEFIQKNCLQDRIESSYRLKLRFPDRLPVIVERKNEHSSPITKTKFLVPKDATLGQLVYILRRYIALRPEQTVVFWTYPSNILPSCSANMTDIFANNMYDDGFLYLIYSNENVFG